LLDIDLWPTRVPFAAQAYAPFVLNLLLDRRFILRRVRMWPIPAASNAGWPARVPFAARRIEAFGCFVFVFVCHLTIDSRVKMNRQL